MNDLFVLDRADATDEPHFLLSHGVARVDDRRVISGIIFVIEPDCVGATRGPAIARTRLSTTGSSAKAVSVLRQDIQRIGSQVGQSSRLMIDVTHLKANRTAASFLKNGPVSRRIERTKGGLNSKLHALCEGQKCL